MSRPARTRRMSSRELMAKEASNPSPSPRVRAPIPPSAPRQQQQHQQQQQQQQLPPSSGGKGRERRQSFSKALASVGNSVTSSAKKMWRRKSVMARSMDKAYGSAPAPPPPSFGGGGARSANNNNSAAAAPVRPPTHRGFVGSSLTVLDDGETTAQTMRVFLMNNSFYEFDIEPTTLAGEVCLDMRESLKLHNDAACSLFSYINGSYFLLQDDDIVLDSVRGWNPEDAETGSARLVYKARIYIPEGHMVLEAENAETALNGAHRICFIDAVHRIITGLYSIPVEAAPMLAALQLQSAIGDYDTATHGPTYISDTGLENYVAPALMSSFDGDEELEDTIREEHIRLVGTSRFQAEQRYMDLVKSHVDCYGASFFAVRVMVQATDSEDERSEPEPAIVAISFDGIFLMSGWNLSVQSFHSFEVVTKWTVASNPDLFAFSVHDQMIYFLLCENPTAIEDCVQMHISTIINERRGAPSPNRRNEDRVRAAALERFGSARTTTMNDATDAANKADKAGSGGINSYGPLPDGWSALADSSTGKTYFWHEETGKTSWTHPSFKPPPPPVAPAAPLPSTKAAAPPNKNKRRMTKRRKSALMHMASRRRASVSMVMAVSNAAATATSSSSSAADDMPTEESATNSVVAEAVSLNIPNLMTRLDIGTGEEPAVAADGESAGEADAEETTPDEIIEVTEDVAADTEVEADIETDTVPETVGELLEEQEVSVIEAWLEANRLGKYFDALTELGVESIEDLKDVLEDDLKPIGMKKLEMRRYLAAVEKL
jgi:hypothetical protein